jgi:hypothetical protein
MFLAILADAKRLLGKTASWRERFVLGGAKFYDDVTVTHSDASYFRSIYETQFDPALCAQPHTAAQEDQIAFASGSGTVKDDDGTDQPTGFKPMYYTHSYAQDPAKIEMSFDCTNYQHQFRQSSGPPHASSSQQPPHPQNPDDPINQIPSQPLPESETAFDYHVFQSIFLDKRNSGMWTMNQIDSSKIIEKKWWHQLGHRWQHYVRVVPGMMWIQGAGRKRTWYAGSWTLVVSFFSFSSLFLFLDGRGADLLIRICMNWLSYPVSRLRIVWELSIDRLTILRQISLGSICLRRMGCFIRRGRGRTRIGRLGLRW